MNRSLDVELVLREYLADDGLTAPDRVLDVVEQRISREPRRQAGPFQGRTNVTSQMKLLAGLAAAIVVAVAGYSLLLQGGIGGPGTTPTVAPTPTAQPAAGATPVPSARRWPLWYTEFDTGMGTFPGSGILAAGSHTKTSFEPNFTFSVPAGWVNHDSDGVNYYGLFPDTPANEAEYGRSGLIAQSIVLANWNHPPFICTSGDNNQGATAAEMVTIVTASQALATSGLVDVGIGGLTGKQFDVRRSPDWTGTCVQGPDLPAGPDPEDERLRVILLDAPTTIDRSPGVIVFLVRSMTSADFEAFLAEAMPIIQTFDFTNVPPVHEGSLPAGRYVLQASSPGQPTITAEVPAGWEGWVDLETVTVPAEFDQRRVSVVFQRATGIFRDPCHWDSAGIGDVNQPGNVQVGPAAIDLVNALREQPALQPTTPNPAVLGGYPGYEMEIEFPADVSLETCDAYIVGGSHYVEVFSGGGVFPYFFKEGFRMRLVIADVQGTRIIATIIYAADAPAAEVEAARAIVESVEFGP